MKPMPEQETPRQEPDPPPQKVDSTETPTSEPSDEKPSGAPESIPVEVSGPAEPAEPVEPAPAPPEPQDIIRLATILEAQLSALLDPMELLSRACRQQLNADIPVFQFRRSGPHDCGIRYRLDWYQGGVEVATVDGTIPLPNLLSSPQLKDAWARVQQVLQTLVLEPFMDDIMASITGAVEAKIPRKALGPHTGSAGASLADTGL